MNSDLCWLGIQDLRSTMDSREITCRQLVEELLSRIEAIDRSGPTLRSVIQTNANVLQRAEELDAVPNSDRGRLHGIPVLVKDNIDTLDGLETTAGSLALLGTRPKRDAFVVRRLQDAGALILGKANMSEWANFRSTHSTSGWSGRGGQCRNPYVLDRSPCGSSSGSAAAVAAGLCPASLGSETDGSIVCPGSMCGVVGIKPTVGLTSRSGVIPISHSQDSIGPFARTVEDAAVVLSVIAGADPDDPMARQGDSELHGFDSGDLGDIRIGIARERFFGYSRDADAIAQDAVSGLVELGAEMVDPADIPSLGEMRESKAEITLMLYEFKHGIERYLAELEGDGPKSLGDLIDFNASHASEEMPFFGQELFEQAVEKGGLDSQEYLDAVADAKRLSREEGLDALFREHRLNALLMPTTAPAFTIDLINGDHFVGGSSSPAAVAGYPLMTVPAGSAHGLPVGITLVAPALQERTLLRIAHAFERARGPLKRPEFLSTANVP